MKDVEIKLPENYFEITKIVENSLSKAVQDSAIFNKSSSQFKTIMLDVVDLTPINSAKHLLAIVQKTRHALEEASINMRRKKLELSRKETELLSASGYEAEQLLIDIDEIKLNITNLEESGQGAIRKIANALEQYNNILKQLGKEQLTELDYEKDQVRYHIMTAFNQALTAARSRGGLIDEGNHIYLFQLGINGAVAQKEITDLLEAEQEAINNGIEPSHEALIQWLNLLADRFSVYPEIYANIRKMPVLNESLLISLEDKKN